MNSYLYAMLLNDDIQARWWKLEEKLINRFGKKPDLESVLFLIGIQEFGQLKDKFNKEEKQDLMHVAVCSLLADSGFYDLEAGFLISALIILYCAFFQFSFYIFATINN